MRFYKQFFKGILANNIETQNYYMYNPTKSIVRFVTAFLFFVICLVLYCVVIVVIVKGRGLITETAGTLVTRLVLSADEQ